MLLLGCCSGGWEGSVAVGVCGGGMLWGGESVWLGLFIIFL